MPVSLPRAPLLVALVSLAGSGCASAGRLAEYDFTDRSLSVVTTTPPRPEILSGDDVDLSGESVAGALLRIGTGIAKEVQAGKARARIDSAVVSVDVAGRLADRVLEQGARQLRARPVPDAGAGEYELEVRVRKYGIEADDWDSQARFFMEADVFLLDGASGSEIWKARVKEHEDINRNAWGMEPAGVVNDLVTAGALATLSVQEIERALEYLADYCGDRVVDKLRKGLRKARG